MVNSILKLLLPLLTWIKNHKRVAAEAILSLLLALSVVGGLTVYKLNKSLSESLEIANNNIIAYLDIANLSLLACGVLKLDMENLLNTNDKLIQLIDSVAKANKIKNLNTAATQTQTILVSKSKGVRGDIITILRDTTYTDIIEYNDQTKVYYNINKDSVDVKLDIKNTQYLYTYKTRLYKNKKNFFKRLITFDWKKVDIYKYKVVNTNDAIQESDVRVIELN